MNTNQPRPRRSYRLAWLLLLLGCLAALASTQRDWLAEIPNALAERALAQRADGRAVEWLDLAKRISKTNAKTEYLLGRLRRRQGMMSQAEEHLKRAHYLGFDPEQLTREGWLAAAQSGQMTLAEPQLANLLMAPRGDGSEICEAYVIGYLKLRRFDSALELITSWRTDYPQDAQPCYWAGQIYRDLYLLDEAEQNLREALQKDPTHAEAALALAEVLLEAKNADAAVPYFRQAQRKEKCRTEASLGLARALRATGQTGEAQTVLDQLHAQFPENVEAAIELAGLEIESGDYAAAERRLQPLLANHARDRLLRFTYGTALRGLGRHEEAQQHIDYSTLAGQKIAQANDLSTKVGRDPANVELRHQIGQLHLEYGSPQEGLIWLHSALEFDPRHQPTHQLLAEYYQAKAAQDPKYAALARRHLLAAATTQSHAPKSVAPLP